MRLHVSPPTVDERQWIAARSALCPSMRSIRRGSLSDIARCNESLQPGIHARRASARAAVLRFRRAQLGSIWAWHVSKCAIQHTAVKEGSCATVRCVRRSSEVGGHCCKNTSLVDIIPQYPAAVAWCAELARQDIRRIDEL